MQQGSITVYLGEATENGFAVSSVHQFGWAAENSHTAAANFARLACQTCEKMEARIEFLKEKKLKLAE